VSVCVCPWLIRSGRVRRAGASRLRGIPVAWLKPPATRPGIFERRERRGFESSDASGAQTLLGKGPCRTYQRGMSSGAHGRAEDHQ